MMQLDIGHTQDASALIGCLASARKKRVKKFDTVVSKINIDVVHMGECSMFIFTMLRLVQQQSRT
jgi:hypothetical protein